MDDEPVLCECLAGRKLIPGDAHDDARQAEAKSLERRRAAGADCEVRARHERRHVGDVPVDARAWAHRRFRRERFSVRIVRPDKNVRLDVRERRLAERIQGKCRQISGISAAEKHEDAPESPVSRPRALARGRELGPQQRVSRAKQQVIGARTALRTALGAIVLIQEDIALMLASRQVSYHQQTIRVRTKSSFPGGIE